MIFVELLQKSDEAGSSKRTVDSGSLNGSIKRQKPKLVSGLAKVVSIVFFCSVRNADMSRNFMQCFN